MKEILMKEKQYIKKLESTIERQRRKGIKEEIFKSDGSLQIPLLFLIYFQK
jgi:hypothetical protein